MADFEFGESRAIGFVSRTWFGGIKNARHFLWSRILKCCQTWESDSRFEGCQHITLFDHRSMYVHHPSMAHLEKSRPKSTAKQYSINIRCFHVQGGSILQILHLSIFSGTLG